jgi:putative transposase
LGIILISKNTVKRILHAGGFATGPKRGAGSWEDFLKRHAVSPWQCDFLSRRVVTISGIRDGFHPCENTAGDRLASHVAPP